MATIRFLDLGPTLVSALQAGDRVAEYGDSVRSVGPSNSYGDDVLEVRWQGRPDITFLAPGTRVTVTRTLLPGQYVYDPDDGPGDQGENLPAVGISAGQSLDDDDQDDPW